jgi:hypothetical protein
MIEFALLNELVQWVVHRFRSAQNDRPETLRKPRSPPCQKKLPVGLLSFLVILLTGFVEGVDKWSLRKGW